MNLFIFLIVEKNFDVRHRRQLIKNKTRYLITCHLTSDRLINLNFKLVIELVIKKKEYQMDVWY